MSRVTIDLRGMPAVRRMIASVDDRERTNRERRAVRAAGNVFKRAIDREVASRASAGPNHVPRSFRKIRVRVSTRRAGGPTAIVRPTSPLLSIFEGGAGAHTIGRPGQILVNRATRFRARGPVHHPGMSARPVLHPAFTADVGHAAETGTAIIFGRPGAPLGSV